MSSGPAHPAAFLYNSRAADYDSTWHSSFVHTFVSHLPGLPSSCRVLDLACGTGLNTFAVASCLQAGSSIIGVDASPGMLAEARKKLSRSTDTDVQIKFIEHDILDLDCLAAVQDGQFDLITCVSAFVLLPDPYVALAHWMRYLAPGGIIALDVTHPQNLISGIVLERTATKVGVTVPYYRERSQGQSKLRAIFEHAGLEILSVQLENQEGWDVRYHDAGQKTANEVFEKHLGSESARAFREEAERDPAFLEKAREAFRAEWKTLEVDGRVEEVDGVYIGVARKPASSESVKAPVNKPKVVGGCRCGAVRYEAFAYPAGTVVCHCFTCGRLSGAGNLPFIDVPTSAFQYIERRGLKTLRVSDVARRTFCADCGSPVTMVYSESKDFEEEKGKVYIVLGSVDEGELTGEVPKVWGHIFISEKCAWEVLPEDGARRLRRFTKDAD